MSLKLIDFKPLWLLSIAPIVFGLCSCSNAPAGTSTGAAAGPVTAAVYQTSIGSNSLLASQPGVTFATTVTVGSTTIQVTPANVLQPWDGVGGALTDSAATVIAALPAAQQQTVLASLFSPTNGIGLNMVRLPMGSSDFSASGNYSYDDVASGTTDTTLAHFSIAHDQTNIIPLLQSVATINPNMKLIASPWSPPAWMKTNGSMNGVANASTTTSQINPAYFSSLASYFVDFIKGYQAQGLSIYAISAQNEPLNSNGTYPTAILTPTDESTFIATNLGPALTTAGLSSVKIFGMEDNWADTSYADTVLQSSASTYLAGTSFHWYTGAVGAMSTVEALNQNKGVWFTEATDTVSCATTCPTLTGPILSASGFALQMQSLIIGVPQNHGRSVVAWNVALNQNEGPQNNGCKDCVGIVTIDSSTTPASVYFNTLYYALGHIGKFVTPGAFVIGTTTTASSAVQDTAFLNPDGSIVLVAFNASSSAAAVTVQWNSQSFNYTIPANAAVTFKWLPS
jgi:glucosylceramidase